MLLHDALDNGLESLEEIRECQVISFQHPASVALDHRQARTRQDRRRRSLEHAIDLRGLREVSNLGSTAVVSDRRQQVILDHSSQGHVWTEPLWFLLCEDGELLCGVL